MEGTGMSGIRWIALALLLVAAPAVFADDVSKSTRLLCTSVQATSCNDETDCITDVPWGFNIPQFIEVDLTNKRLSTTKASGEARQSPIANLLRAEGLIVIQGFEHGRAFNFVINEQTGRLSATVARDGITVSVFGACTPLEGK
jgi:hypothetical protein